MFTDKTARHYILGSDGAYHLTKTFRINLQPETGESTALIGGVFGQTFRGFTTYSGLNINDTVTISGTTTISGMRYRVRAVMPYNYGPLRHYEVVVTLPEV